MFNENIQALQLPELIILEITFVYFLYNIEFLLEEFIYREFTQMEKEFEFDLQGGSPGGYPVILA